MKKQSNTKQVKKAAKKVEQAEFEPIKMTFAVSSLAVISLLLMALLAVT